MELNRQRVMKELLSVRDLDFEYFTVISSSIVIKNGLRLY